MTSQQHIPYHGASPYYGGFQPSALHRYPQTSEVASIQPITQDSGSKLHHRPGTSYWGPSENPSQPDYWHDRSYARPRSYAPRGQLRPYPQSYSGPKPYPDPYYSNNMSTTSPYYANVQSYQHPGQTVPPQGRYPSAVPWYTTLPNDHNYNIPRKSPTPPPSPPWPWFNPTCTEQYLNHHTRPSSPSALPDLSIDIDNLTLKDGTSTTRSSSMHSERPASSSCQVRHGVDASHPSARSSNSKSKEGRRNSSPPLKSILRNPFTQKHDQTNPVQPIASGSSSRPDEAVGNLESQVSLESTPKLYQMKEKGTLDAGLQNFNPSKSSKGKGKERALSACQDDGDDDVRRSGTPSPVSWSQWEKTCPENLSLQPFASSSGSNNNYSRDEHSEHWHVSAAKSRGPGQDLNKGRDTADKQSFENSPTRATAMKSTSKPKQIGDFHRPATPYCKTHLPPDIPRHIAVDPSPSKTVVTVVPKMSEKVIVQGDHKRKRRLSAYALGLTSRRDV